MTNDRSFDRTARAWLDLMPSEAPDRVIDAVLQAVESTPQMRPTLGAALRRPIFMNRLSLTAVAVVIVVVFAAGALVLTRFNAPQVGTPSPTPAVTTSASAPAGAVLPAALQHTWIGADRPVAGAPSVAGLALITTDQSVQVSASNQLNAPLLAAAADVDGSRHLRVRSTANTSGCHTGDTGTYGYAISTSGRQLTLSSLSDMCADRVATLSGTWFLNGCKRTDEVCLGLLDPGTYGSQYFATHLGPGGSWTPAYGRLTFTVPDGWAEAEDWPDYLRLAPATLYGTEGPTGANDRLEASIEVLSHVGLPPASDHCAGVISTSDHTYAGVVAAMRSVPGSVVTNAHDVTVGALQATSFDLTVDPAWTTSCPGDVQPSVPLVGDGDRGLGLYKQEHARLLLVNTGTDVAAVLIHAPDAQSFDALAPSATGIAQSFVFK